MRKALQAWMLAAALVPAALVGQDLNVTRPAVELERLLAEAPMRIVSAEISRPKAKGDITLKADVAFGDEPPMRVKLRKSMPGADEFNNVPRYDLAAQELQKLLVDPVDYFVPPTALRFVPIDEFRRYADDVRPRCSPCCSTGCRRSRSSRTCSARRVSRPILSTHGTSAS